MYLFFSPPFLYVTPCSSSSWSTFSPSFPSSLDFSPQPFPSFSRNPLLSIVLDFSLQYHTNLTLPNPFCYLHFHELWSLLQSPLSPPRDTLYRFIQLTPEVLFLFLLTSSLCGMPQTHDFVNQPALSLTATVLKLNVTPHFCLSFSLVTS